MKKRILAALLTFATIALLSACSGFGNASSDGAGNVTLTILGRKSDLEKSYMANIFGQYEEATGNRLDIIAIEDANFEAEASKRFEEGDIPDIFMHFHNSDLTKYDVEAHFCSLNDEVWVADLTDAAKAYCQDQKGNIMGLPFWESSVSGCYYNKTLLDRLGLKPAATQAEFDVLCQAITDIGYTPICWPADGCTWMFQFGLDPVFADNPDLLEKLNRNEITYADIPQVTDMVQWISDAAEKGWFGTGYLNNGWSDISSIMASGNSVMIFIWDTWFYTDFERESTYDLEDFEVMPVFMGTTDNGTYEGGNLNMLMVNRDSERKEEAKEFLAFCATPEHYNAAFAGISTVSCFQGQTTNIQSHMVLNAEASIEENQRVSTAASKIIGYSADDVAAAFLDLFQGKVDVAGCVKMMDDLRTAAARAQGAEGFY